MKKFRFLLLMISALLITTAACADTWTLVNENDQISSAGQDNAYTGTVTITFLGDCTFGGEADKSGNSSSFDSVISKNGMDWPLKNLLALTSADDITLANLEGVLSDRKLTKQKKTYNFIGSTAYTQILSLGSVECVSLANNHTHDYGEEGYQDTVSAVTNTGLAWFGSDSMAVWERDGLKIGFVGISSTASGNQGKRLKNRISALKDMGCAAVITIMHAGTEYKQKVDAHQNDIVKKAISAGTCLIVGHHPHVVQGFEIRDSVPVVYSLGNCSFGGNRNPKDKDALVLQTVLTFEAGCLKKTELHFYPISISSVSDMNDYSPVLLKGQDAERILKKMQQSTGYEMPAFEEGKGSVITVEYD